MTEWTTLMKVHAPRFEGQLGYAAAITALINGSSLKGVGKSEFGGGVGVRSGAIAFNLKGCRTPIYSSWPLVFRRLGR